MAGRKISDIFICYDKRGKESRGKYFQNNEEVTEGRNEGKE